MEGVQVPFQMDRCQKCLNRCASIRQGHDDQHGVWIWLRLLHIQDTRRPLLTYSWDRLLLSISNPVRPGLWVSAGLCRSLSR